ncbi:MAG: DUF4169 family protein [Rhizobiaceae bacterium]|nr:DUF4169 family protein [Rhizobiaceae bacterium]MCV0405188.1 DUF4169 family protein [Rhizobiaceae bacterium]
MAEIVNLRMARKARARAEREADAERNRIAHGLTRVERVKAAAERAAGSRALDGHRRERPGDDADR